MAAQVTPLAALLDEVLGPLITGDEGELYIVEATEAGVHLHLRGRFSGCPGNTLVIQQVIEPAILSALPECAVSVTTGELVLDGAVRWAGTPEALGVD